MKNPLDSRQLRAFVALARTGSFTVAGRQLFLSQSAVSHSMKALEEDVGCRLLDRLGKRVVLTQAGEQLLHHAGKILGEMAAARSSLEHLGKWGHTRLRLGASTTACQHLLPPVLRELKAKHPHCIVTIEPGDTAENVTLLRDGKVDLALVLEPPLEERFEFKPLFHDSLQFMVEPSHPWAVSGRIERAEIPKQSYIFYSKSSVTFRMVESYFRDEDMVLNSVIELGSMGAIKELVKLGLGVGILAAWTAQEELASRALVALPTGRRKLRRTWGVLHWRGRRLSLPEEAFVAQCRNVTADWSARGIVEPVTA
jgi:DNA-binding transcriptional LysR family regulator